MHVALPQPQYWLQVWVLVPQLPHATVCIEPGSQTPVSFRHAPYALTLPPGPPSASASQIAWDWPHLPHDLVKMAFAVGQASPVFGGGGPASLPESTLAASV